MAGRTVLCKGSGAAPEVPSGLSAMSRKETLDEEKGVARKAFKKEKGDGSLFWGKRQRFWADGGGKHRSEGGEAIDLKKERRKAEKRIDYGIRNCTRRGRRAVGKRRACAKTEKRRTVKGNVPQEKTTLGALKKSAGGKKPTRRGEYNFLPGRKDSDEVRARLSGGGKNQEGPVRIFETG